MISQTVRKISNVIMDTFMIMHPVYKQSNVAACRMEECLMLGLNNFFSVKSLCEKSQFNFSYTFTCPKEMYSKFTSVNIVKFSKFLLLFASVSSFLRTDSDFTSL